MRGEGWFDLNVRKEGDDVRNVGGGCTCGWGYKGSKRFRTWGAGWTRMVGGGGGVLRLSGGMMGVLSCGRKNATGISKKIQCTRLTLKRTFVPPLCRAVHK